MRDSGAAACRPYLPSASLTDVEDQLAQGAFTDDNRYGDFIASQNRLLTPDQLRCLPAFTEGLENRWHRAFMENGSYAQALKLSRRGAMPTAASAEWELTPSYSHRRTSWTALMKQGRNMPVSWPSTGEARPS